MATANRKAQGNVNATIRGGIKTGAHIFGLEPSPVRIIHMPPAGASVSRPLPPARGRMPAPLRHREGRVAVAVVNGKPIIDQSRAQRALDSARRKAKRCHATIRRFVCDMATVLDEFGGRCSLRQLRRALRARGWCRLNTVAQSFEEKVRRAGFLVVDGYACTGL